MSSGRPFGRLVVLNMDRGSFTDAISGLTDVPYALCIHLSLNVNVDAIKLNTVHVSKDA